MKTLFFLIAITLLSCSKSNTAPMPASNQSLVGTWTQDSARYNTGTQVQTVCETCNWSDQVTFNSNGTGQDQTKNGIDGQGSYTVSGNTLNCLWKLSPAQCGSYTFTVNGNKLILSNMSSVNNPYTAWYHK